MDTPRDVHPIVVIGALIIIYVVKGESQLIHVSENYWVLVHNFSWSQI